MSKDCYKVLGIPRNASIEEIKASFRRQAHIYHPDKKGGNEAKFKEINEAYQILGHPLRRQQYDASGVSNSTDENFANTGLTWDQFKNRAMAGPATEAEGFYDTIFDEVLEGAVGLVDDLLHKIDF